ncbi:hypothetical protein [Nocardia sp. XZ_19_385]|uniref:hypothetical protein n=1 Tax=Nocardia sp. XZ_19_385 TaxID=2769488 RepID=UPI00188E753F|nr:hypothetical protein [Nocardia sp. XZ_19_385]
MNGTARPPGFGLSNFARSFLLSTAVVASGDMSSVSNPVAKAIAFRKFSKQSDFSDLLSGFSVPLALFSWTTQCFCDSASARTGISPGVANPIATVPASKTLKRNLDCQHRIATSSATRCSLRISIADQSPELHPRGDDT